MAGYSIVEKLICCGVTIKLAQAETVLEPYNGSVEYKRSSHRIVR